MAIAIALPGFNDLGRSVTPIFFILFYFFLMDHFFYQFSTRSLNFWKMHHRIPFFSALRLSVRRFQTSLEASSFVKTLAFGTIYATDPILHNMINIEHSCIDI